MPKHKIILGGIVKHNNGGCGFKITFPNQKQANYYKKMFDYIIKSDNIKVENKKGYYDNML